MDRNAALLIVSSAHQTALALGNSRHELSESEQETLYTRVYISLLQENVASMRIAELLDALSGS
jgi:hypothetical protein